MSPKKRITTHPGEILQAEFLEPMGISQTELAEHIGARAPNINDIVKGRRGISPEMAWKLARALGTSPEFWTNLQASYDLARARAESASIRPLKKAG